MSDPIMSYSDLARLVRGLEPSCGRVRIVAVDGPSGAGKSTFADRLAAALGGAPVIRSDEFPVPWDGDPLAWWPPFEDQVLRPLAAGLPVRYRPYDWRTARYGDPVFLPAPEVLIVDGVGSAWQGAPVSYRIWLDAPSDLRRRRALARDGTELAGAWDRWAKSEAAHFTADATRAHADLRLDGTNPR